MCVADLPTTLPTPFHRDNQRPAQLPFSVTPSVITRYQWYRNVYLLCIDYAFRPRLSSRLTLGGLAFPRNPWASGGGVSHPSFATHACILTRSRSTPVHTVASQRDRRSPTARTCVRTRGFGSRLE